jgi:hypothetical protein
MIPQPQSLDCGEVRGEAHCDYASRKQQPFPAAFTPARNTRMVAGCDCRPACRQPPRLKITWCRTEGIVLASERVDHVWISFARLV